jgi:signal transduction histidine kinase/CheY-like chemotaxis protein
MDRHFLCNIFTLSRQSLLLLNICKCVNYVIHNIFFVTRMAINSFNFNMLLFIGLKFIRVNMNQTDKSSELIIANEKLVIQCEENKKSTADLYIADKELVFQMKEKKKRAEEYLILNQELIESLNQIQEINKELIVAKDKAEESDRLKTIFLENMSHEIRTPMNSIMGFSDLLLNPGFTHEKQMYFAQIIHTSCQQLLTVINDILDMSKIESSQIVLNAELVDVNKMLKKLYLIYSKTAELKNIRFTYHCEYPDDLIQVITDGERIKQVFCNLLCNSFKFTREGKIDFGYKIEGNFIEFYVTDTGIGIAPKDLKLIFENFRQVTATENCINFGIGLGLSISKALVEKMGGNFTLESDLGKGSTFVFMIPYLKKGEENTLTKTDIKEKQFINGKGKTILIAEDEVNCYAYLEEVLSASNVKIIHAWDGIEAVEYVKSDPNIALVLMDIKMQKMDGYEALRLIKQTRPELPVVAQTAFALNLEETQTPHAGFDNYLSKPIAKDKLVEIIAGYLN